MPWNREPSERCLSTSRRHPEKPLGLTWPGGPWQHVQPGPVRTRGPCLHPAGCAPAAPHPRCVRGAVRETLPQAGPPRQSVPATLRLLPSGKCQGSEEARQDLTGRQQRNTVNGRRRAPGRVRYAGRVLHADAPGHVPPSSMRVQPTRVPVPSLGMGTRCDGAILDPPLLRPEVAPFLPARLPFGPVNGRQDGQRHDDPQQRRPQHQGNFQLSAHAHNFRPPGPKPTPADPHYGAQIRSAYSRPSPLTAAMTSGTWIASSAGSGCAANVSPRRSSVRVRTTWGPGGGPQISGGAGPKSTTEGVP